VILILLLIGALPAWAYSTRWGYYRVPGSDGAQDNEDSSVFSVSECLSVRNFLTLKLRRSVVSAQHSSPKLMAEMS
jgi:Protein of unknown function (DUF3309)